MQNSEIQHPSFPQPNNLQIRVWRYMERYKFNWLIDEKRLYMPCATMLGDSLEGTLPLSENEWWEKRIKEANDGEKIFMSSTIIKP